jgi:hypothetical protein
MITGKVAVTCPINSTFLKSWQFHNADEPLAYRFISLGVPELGGLILY